MSSVVSTTIIVVILIVILFFAVKNSLPHFRGEGGCCGGDAQEKRIKPAKLEHVIEEKVISIEGMHCENCTRRVQNALNSLDGVSAKVSGERKEAVVKLGRELSDSELSDLITGLGYRVVSIETSASVFN